MKSICIFGISFLLVACSNQQIYTAVQQNQQLECSKLPQTRYEECMRELEGSYEEYEQDRQEMEGRDQQ
jgi:hypothetical protein